MTQSGQKPHQPGAQEIDVLVALFNGGRYAEAEAVAQAMTQRYPADGFSWKVLGLVLKQRGRTQEALHPMEKAISLSPMDADAHNNLGIALNELGRFTEAETSLLRALKINPNYADAHSNLGALLCDMSRLDEAERCYRRALEINPKLAATHYNLGNILKETSRLEDAINAYQQALQIKPDYAQAVNNLGMTLHALGHATEAENLARIAIAIQPDLVQGHNNLGIILQDAGRFIEAEESYRRALQLAPNLAEIWNNLGITLQEMGRLDESEGCYRRALELKPDYASAHSGLLFTFNYNHESAPDENFREAKAYGERISHLVKHRYASWSCEKNPDRLRIGFVSGDLKNHPVGYFLENLLAHLDQTSFELYAYPTDRVTDVLTARIKPYFAAWKPLYGLNDGAAAALIHNDSLHILIDLAGHTRYNRLPVFARKPAPVQISWLGYFATTGLKEMDYLIADASTLPECDEKYFTEKIWRLPQTRLCFTPPEIDVPVSSLPALANGHITFGCFNNLTKINDKVVELWSNILAALPDSRLFLKSKQLQDASMRQQTIARFTAHGIAADRLILEGTCSRADYFKSYHRIDIALDPFPYPGGTTSVESLWMGVPVLTLMGSSFLSRQGAGIMVNAGLSNWVASDEDEYVVYAANYVRDTQTLKLLRLDLRRQILASPVMDGQNFALHFATALHEMWLDKHQE